MYAVLMMLMTRYLGVTSRVGWPWYGRAGRGGAPTKSHPHVKLFRERVNVQWVI